MHKKYDKAILNILFRSGVYNIHMVYSLQCIEYSVLTVLYWKYMATDFWWMRSFVLLVFALFLSFF